MWQTTKHKYTLIKRNGAQKQYRYSLILMILLYTFYRFKIALTKPAAMRVSSIGITRNPAFSGENRICLIVDVCLFSELFV